VPDAFAVESEFYDPKSGFANFDFANPATLISDVHWEEGNYDYLEDFCDGFDALGSDSLHGGLVMMQNANLRVGTDLAKPP